MGSVSALAKPLTEMLRLVGSSHKFYKHWLKYGHHKSFFTSYFKMVENKVQKIKHPKMGFWTFVCSYKGFSCKIALYQR